MDSSSSHSGADLSSDGPRDTLAERFSMAGSVTEFTSIFQENGLEPGKLRMAETGMGWKGDFEAKASTIGAADLKWMQWIRVARGFQLRIGLKGEKRRVAYEGFEREDHERLRNAVNHYYNITLEEKDTSVRGWNWGYADIQGDDLAFLVAGKPAFTVPLNTVHNTSINKAEVALEFRDENMLNQIKKLEADRDNKEARKMRRAAPDEMVEVRFYIPGTVGESRRRGKQAKKDAVDAEVKAKREEDDDEEKKPSRESGSEAEDEDDEDQAAAETFFETIKEKAEIGQVQGETLVSFPDILCTTPRGRFDVDMFPDFLRLRGKTYDYKIMYSSIVKLFLLPRTDDIHVQFIINLEPPIRQGQTRYPYLIMQFAKEEEMDAEIQMEEKEIQEKYQGKLEKRYEAPAYEVVSSIFRALSGKKVTIPGNFQSHGGHSAVKANFGAMEGHLFFLDKALLYISRNPLYVPYSDISEIRFERVSGALTTSGRTFDLIVQLKGSRNEHTFSALSKEEQSSVEDYLKHEKKLKVKNVMEENVQAVNSAIAEALMDEDSDDDDAPRQRGGDEDEDSEVDEDFKAGSDDDDVAEEFDENYSGSSSGDSDASSDDDAEDDDDDDAMEEDEAPAKKKAPATKTKSKGSDSEAPAKKKQKKNKE